MAPLCWAGNGLQVVAGANLMSTASEGGENILEQLSDSLLDAITLSCGGVHGAIFKFPTTAPGLPACINSQVLAPLSFV